MSAMDHCSMLTRLVDAGEKFVAMRNAGPTGVDDLTQLCAAVTKELHKPADGHRVIHQYTAIFAQALVSGDIELRTYGRGHVAPYIRIVGSLMPDIRKDLGEAIEVRKRPTP